MIIKYYDIERTILKMGTEKKGQFLNHDISSLTFFHTTWNTWKQNSTSERIWEGGGHPLPPYFVREGGEIMHGRQEAWERWYGLLTSHAARTNQFMSNFWKPIISAVNHRKT